MCHQRKDSFACLAERAGATPRICWAAESRKSGVAPAQSGVFSVTLFSSSCLLFPRFPVTYAHPKPKKMLKTKLKCVIPTFFSCFAQILAARAERSFLLGWSDPRLTLGTEPCARVGSLPPNSVFCARPN